jgi:rubrerythrin
MSLREAMTLALDNELAAEGFYRQVADSSSDPETARLAGVFAAEEAAHAEALRGMIAALAADAPHHREDDDEPHMPE